MKTASMVLGIVGGTFLLLISLFVVVLSTIGFSSLPTAQGADVAVAMISVWFGFGILGGILSIIGGALVRRKNVLGGVFMLIGALSGFVTIFSILPAIALIIGGVFAFIKEPSQQYAPPQSVAGAQPPLVHSGQATQDNVVYHNSTTIKPYAQIKQQARENFKSQYGTSVGALVLVFIIVYTLTIIYYAFFYPFNTPPHMTLYIGRLIGMQLFNLLSMGAAVFVYTAVMVSYNGFTLRIFRGNQASVEEMFRTGFSGYWRKVGGMLWMQLFVGLWSLLFVIPGIIKAYSYFMAPYILADCPNVKATDALKLSMRMTAGYKGDIFVMQLTFIGWWLLSILTLGVLGIFYTGPYYFTSMAGLYEDLKRVALENGTVTPQDLGIEVPETALV